MVVQHNMQAINSNRMLGITERTVAGSTEKLSSGYAINRAADNAAGLAISEKMRKQVRGLTQASTNAEDGISSVQTAEGALAEVQDMLQRMNELCVQAANGTNSKTDRQYIQDEVDQLVKEVDRVAETTKFNETYLLKGDETGKTSRSYIVNYSIEKTPNITSNAAINANALDYKVNYTGSNNVYILDKAILTADKSSPVSAKEIKTNQDITDYMQKGNVQATYHDTFKYDTAAATGITTVDRTTVGADSIYVDDNGVAVKLSKDNAGRYFEYAADGTTIVAKNGYSFYGDADITDNNKLINPQKDAAKRLEGITYDPATIKDASNTNVTTAYAFNAATNTNVAVTAGNIGNFIETLPDGTKAVKSGYAFYSADATPQLETTRIADADMLSTVNKLPKKKLYSAGDGSVEVTEDELHKYFNEDGTRNNYGKLYYENTPGVYAEIGNTTLLSQYIDVNASANENLENAEFNSKNYAAFVAIELDSNVLSGSNGNVAGGVSDLSTDGITNTVRANRDLYVYTRETGTITHLAAGDDMTAYLNDNNTMNDKYVLMDVLDSESGTSYAVMTQLLGARDDDGDGTIDTYSQYDADGDGTVDTDLTNFRWDNKYIAADTSTHKLYDKEGQEVSGMKLNKYFDENGNYTGGLYTTAQARVIDQVYANDTSEEYALLKASGYEPTLIDDYITKSSTEVNAELAFTLHVGADSKDENKINVGLTTLTSAGIGVDKLASGNIGIVDETGQLATDAIDVVAASIDQISRQRAALGAAQNRLEHTIKNLDNVVENTQSAESTIRDTDMATEMVKYSNANILQQAGQSMLAQSNQANQGVLSLLQ